MVLGAGILQRAKNLPGVEGTYRVINAPRHYGGQVLGPHVDNLQIDTYNQLMQGADDRAAQMTTKVMPSMTPELLENTPEAAEAFRRSNAAMYQQVRDANYDAMAQGAQRQAAIVPGALRFAGSTLTNPGLLGGAIVGGGTLGIGAMMEDQAQRRQLAAMGVSPEEAQLLSEEVTQQMLAEYEAELQKSQQAQYA